MSGNGPSGPPPGPPPGDGDSGRPAGPPPGKKPAGPPPGRQPAGPPPRNEPPGPPPSDPPTGPPKKSAQRPAGKGRPPAKKGRPPAKKPGAGRRAVRALGTLVLLAGTGVGAYLMYQQIKTAEPDGTPAATEVLLQAKSDPGPDPFTAAVDDLIVPADPVQPPAPAGSGPAAVAIPLDGREVGLYGGTGNNQLCDQAQMVAFLQQEPEKAAAWAEAQGIPPEDVGAYITALTPAVLNLDTRVTNHGFRDGRPRPLQSVLQAGTAVLVDDEGTPRARCACGNPLKPPEATTGEVTYTGTAWVGFDPDKLVAPPGTDAVAAPQPGGGSAAPTGAPPAGESVVVNGGFEQPLSAPWGTGIYEASQPEMFWGSADADLAIDTSEAAEGSASLRITNRSESAPQVYRTLSQTVALPTFEPYCLSYLAKVSADAQAGVLSVAVTDDWTIRLSVDPGVTEWSLYRLPFEPEDGEIDIRLITEAPGTVWVDDLRVTPGGC